MAKLVSKTYGQALFEIAVEDEQAGGDKMTELWHEMEQIKTIFKENPDFEKIFDHPGIPKTEKLRTLTEVFDGRISRELEGLFEILIKKDRYKEWPEVFEYYVQKVKEYKQIGVVYVTTAVTPTDAQKTDIEHRMMETTNYRSLEIHYNVDPSLIGGMVIRVNDTVVDSSIKNKLNDLTRQLLQIQLG